MRRLLVLSSTYPRWANDSEPGFVHELSKRFTGSFDVHILCPHSTGAMIRERLDNVTIYRFRYAPSRWESLVQGGGILENLNKSRWKWLLLPTFFAAMTWHTCRLVRRLRPSIVHVHWIIPQGLAVLGARVLATRFPPVIITSHGSDLYRLQGKLLIKLKQKVLAQANAVTVVSRAMRQDAITLGVTPERLHVLPMGVDFIGRFTPGNPALRSSDKLLFVGRLVKQKGLIHLLEALPEVLRHQPSVRLLVAGDGPEHPLLQQYTERLDLADRVQFLGALSQDTLPSLYRNVALTIAPFTGREGLGLVTLEAIGCGCPVIVSNLEAISDLLDPQLDARNLVPPGDSTILANRIVQALSDPETYRQSALEQRSRLAGKFDWKVAAKKYAKLFEELGRV